MKWDIDKALRLLEDDQVSGTSTNIARITFGTDVLGQIGLTPTAKELVKGQIRVWCICLGKIQEDHKLFVHDRTIRGAYLKLRKKIKNLSPEDKEFYGVRLPQRSNSFMAARSLKKRKSKDAPASV